MRDLTLFILAFLLKFSSQRSTPQDDSYVAAVVEYQVQSGLENNIQNFNRLIHEAAEQNADVIVFPELILTSGIEVPILTQLKEHPIPALSPNLYDNFLVNISAAARTQQIYVVVNIQEKMDCNNAPEEYCPEKKVYMFNTNVVFDRNGAVIDRFRKINLFGELSRTPALQPDLGSFTTDFGVTFGHFICFDLMFQVPAIQVVEKLNVTDVIFPTMWFSEMPYLTAVQIQEAYAYSMNVNFLAAGANNVHVGSAGSGIYSGKAGALVSTMPGVPTTRLLVSRVPKVPGQVNFSYPGPIYDKPTDHDSLLLISDPSLPSHVTRMLEPGYQEFTLVDKEVSCKFRVKLNQRGGEPTLRYHTFVQDGSAKYDRRHTGVAICYLVACKNEHPSSCVYKFKENNVEIQELEIEMTTYRLQYNTSLKCSNIVYYPSSLRNSKFPLSPKNFTYVDSRNGAVSQYDGREHITYKLNKPQDELVSFGIWGRVFTKDVDDSHKPVTEEEMRRSNEFMNMIYAAADETNKINNVFYDTV